MKMKNRSRQRAMANLPQELIEEILLRLPIKSLVRFRCVSKPWLSLISNPHFAKRHFKRASQYPNMTTHKILLSTSPHLTSLDYEEAVAACVDNDTLELVDLYFPFKRQDNRVKIVGSCNGLVCIALDYYRDFFIWNPSTGDYKKLPDPDITHDGYKYLYGFGYDLSSDDYKVVVATCPKGESMYQMIFKVFKMRTNLWTSIQDSIHDPYHYVMCTETAEEFSQGYLCNGALHWLSRWSCPQGYFEVIFAFDLVEEKFREVPTPDYSEEVEDVNLNSLGVLGDCLCLSCNTGDQWLIKLWTMKEYGVKASWESLITLGSYDCNKFVPLCFTKSGHIISLSNRQQLEWCNPEERPIMVCDDCNFCEAIVYVETLFSPNALNEIQR